MSFKSRYFILFKSDLNEKIKWPERCGNTCRANLAPMLQEVLKTKAIGAEMKLIWNSEHESQIINEYQITYQQLKSYLKAKVYSLHFQSIGMRKRAFKALENMGANDMVLVDSYKDLLLYQAHFYEHGNFPAQHLTTKK